MSIMSNRKAPMLIATIPIVFQSLTSILGISLFTKGNPFNALSFLPAGTLLKVLTGTVVLFEIIISSIILITSRKNSRGKALAVGATSSLVLAIYNIVFYILPLIAIIFMHFIKGSFGDEFVLFISSFIVLIAMIVSLVYQFILRKKLRNARKSE